MPVTEARRTVLEATTEADWQTAVIEYAHKKGWLVHAMKDSRQQWWGTDSGFPDLVLAREGRVVFAELKDMKGRLGISQRVWAAEIGRAAEVYCWRPSDEAEMWRVLA